MVLFDCGPTRVANEQTDRELELLQVSAELSARPLRFLSHSDDIDFDVMNLILSKLFEVWWAGGG